jgi:hypothetical protein
MRPGLTCIRSSSGTWELLNSRYRPSVEMSAPLSRVSDSGQDGRKREDVFRAISPPLSQFQFADSIRPLHGTAVV